MTFARDLSIELANSALDLDREYPQLIEALTILERQAQAMRDDALTSAQAMQQLQAQSGPGDTSVLGLMRAQSRQQLADMLSTFVQQFYAAHADHAVARAMIRKHLLAPAPLQIARDIRQVGKARDD